MDYLGLLPALAQHFPLIWTLHDMNAFTGGCHFASDCTNYISNCGRCPQLGSKQESDLSRAVWQRKNDAFAAIPVSRLTIVCPSRWMAECLKKSSLLTRFHCEVIPYGLSLRSFAPRNKRWSRDVLGIPEGRKVILFVADYHNRRKGFDILVESLMHLPQDLHILIAGAVNTAQVKGLKFQALGHISNDGILSLAYSAADLFVCPSLEDNLPNTVLEALACGTPVVGFKVGGLFDMVRPRQTGWLAEKCEAIPLAEAIEFALLEINIRGEEISRQCRTLAEREYS